MCLRYPSSPPLEAPPKMLPFYRIVGQGGREGEPPQPLLLLYSLHYGQKNAGKGGDEKSGKRNR